MTKKEYQLITDAILEARGGLAADYDKITCQEQSPDRRVTELFEYAVSWTIREISGALAAGNPQFDPQRFREACLKKVW